MPWDALDLYWVDERCVPPDHADSNYRMTREAMLDHVPLRPEQIHRIQGELPPDAAASAYESDLRSSFRLEGAESPRFDLVALGMGPDGHTASPVINHASSVFFLIAGTDKAAVLNQVLTGPHDPERLPSQLIWPSSGILTLILDKAAAALLPPTDGEGCGFLERDR